MFSFDVMLDPPTAMTESGVSPRSESLTWESAGQSILDKMLQAGASAVAEVFQTTPLGEKVAADVRQKEMWKFLQSPMVVMGGALLLGLLVFAFAGRR